MTTDRETTENADQGPVRFLVLGALIYLLIVAAVALAIGYSGFALGVVAGGTVSLLNLFWLRHHLIQILSISASRKAGLIAQIKLVTRLTVTAILLYVLIVPARLNIAGLVTGLSALFVAVLTYLVAIITRRGNTL